MRRFIFFLLAVCTPVVLWGAPQKETPKERPIRHYLDLYAAGGVSHWNYPLSGGDVRLGGSFSAGIGYTFFFHPNVGLQTGVSFSRIASTARLTEPMEWSQWQDGSPLTDYMGDRYLHRATFNQWQEKQQAYLFEIPLGLRFRYFKDRDSRAGLHAAVGVKAAIPIWANYKHSSGDVTHTGWYDQWQLLLYDLPGRFETEHTEEPQEETMTNRLRAINAEVYAEIGTAIRINPHYELYIAAYGQYIVNDLGAASRDQRVPLGFSNDHNHYAFMPEYRGLTGTDAMGSIHPWSAGIKVGLSIWPGKTDKEKKKELKKLMKQFPDAVQPTLIHDTVYIHDTIHTRDTICPDIRRTDKTRMSRTAQTDQAVQTAQTDHATQAAHQTLDSLLSEAVIWFHFDEYVPILEPAWILDSVAAMMNRYPDLKISVNGHACRIGKDRYNQRLALLRAKAVADLLEEKGIDGERMYLWSYGAERPYRYNSKKQLSKDRRVEIIPRR